MSTMEVFRKTVKGEEEVAQRMLNLPVKLRSLLITIDGRRNAGDLTRSFTALGDVPAMLDELVQKGCIESVPIAHPLTSSPVRATRTLSIEARQYAAEYFYDLLGPDSDAIVRRFEKCKNNEDLVRRFEEGRDILNGMGKARKAEEFWKRVQELMA